jgi:hypothetical protein
MSERKNFPTSIILEVFEEQGRCCGKCGRSLMYGYHTHHKDSDASNNSKENCQLLCSGCHGGEQWQTLQDQKKATIGQLDGLIDKAVRGEVAGAVLDKALDAVKLKLSLQTQVYGEGALEPPAEVKLETYITIMEAKLAEYEKGVKIGIPLGVELAKEKKVTK